MSQKFLDRPQIGSGTEKMCGEAIPEGMGCDFDPVIPDPSLANVSWMPFIRPRVGHQRAALGRGRGKGGGAGERDGLVIAVALVCWWTRCCPMRSTRTSLGSGPSGRGRWGHGSSSNGSVRATWTLTDN